MQLDEDTTLAVIDPVDAGQGAQASPSSKKRTTADMLEESEQLLAKEVVLSSRGAGTDARTRLQFPWGVDHMD